MTIRLIGWILIIIGVSGLAYSLFTVSREHLKPLIGRWKIQGPRRKKKKGREEGK